MSKIIHAGDIHLGAVPHGIGELGLDIDRFVDWLGDLVAEEEPDLLVLAGDTFDTPTPSAADMMPVLRLLRTAENHGCRVAIVDGNHDSSVSSKTRIKTGRPDRTWSQALSSAFPGIMASVTPRIGLTPGPALERTRGGLSVLPLNHVPGSVMKPWLQGLEDWDHVRPDVIVSHQSAAWAVGGIFESELGKEDMDGLAAYCAMGDIHRARTREPECGGVIAYCGPSTALRSPENGHQGVWMVEMTPGVMELGSLERLTPPCMRVPMSATIDVGSDGLVLTMDAGLFYDGAFAMAERRLMSVSEHVAAMERIRGIVPIRSARRGDLTAPPPSMPPGDEWRLFLRVGYPAGMDSVDRSAAEDLGKALLDVLGFDTGVSIAEAYDTGEEREESDMGSWVRATSQDEDATFSDELVEAAIEESAMEVARDESLGEEIAKLAKEVWKNPSDARRILGRP